MSCTVEDTFSVDDFACPVFVHPTFPSSSPFQVAQSKMPLATFDLISTCDPEEWAKRGVALHSVFNTDVLDREKVIFK